VLQHKSAKFWLIVFSVMLVTTAGAGIITRLKGYQSNNTFPLEFTAADTIKIEQLDDSDIKVMTEVIVDKDKSAFIFLDEESGEYRGAVNVDGKSYDIGQVSMENAGEDLPGIEETQVFGMTAVKFYGVLGANYAQAFYWLVERKAEDSVLQIDGNTREVDLDSDDKKEIVATTGTIPETKIYMLKDASIVAADVNKAMGAKAVLLQDESNKLFEVYFEPNKPEQFVYQNDSLLRKIGYRESAV